ncbi:hypothetical protein FB567DRAFT_312682 [Paraphoma chrysanthemicola]|uniref:Peptidase C14 caspase domain-containing protein n=1 Tax=Paraphoma chrysanthemicola TaxID=798071 RepID=A0A8K0W0G7_9PLEO|nr:hypothetical protein FB567DRAFT_312682 [Paraphoma chrysanthemicola]
MATRFAVLIGINAYAESPLKGCVRDVVEVEKRLKKMAEPVHISIFTADLDDFPDPAGLIPVTERTPTFGHVVSCFRRVATLAKPGDLVYIHYSGHGTTIERDHRLSDVGTQDLALVLLEPTAATGMRYLPGLELASMMKVMVDNGLMVTLVLDCCFSGGVVRNDPMIRYIEYDPAVETTYTSDSQRYLGLKSAYHPTTARAAFLLPDWIINPHGYTILTACGPNEVAKELVLNKSGDRHGTLSYFLLRVFAKLGGVGGRQHQIYQHLRARFQELRTKGVNKQTPMFFGNRTLCFFGLESMQIQSHSIPCIRGTNGRIHLEAGKAHGVSKGDEYVVCSLEAATSASTSEQEPIIVKVDEIDELSSTIEVVGAVPSSIETGWMAEVSSSLALRQFPVRLRQGFTSTDTWPTALRSQRSLNIQNHDDTASENPYSLQLLTNDNEHLEIQDSNKGTLAVFLNVAPLPEEEVEQRVIETVTHLVKFQLVRSLANTSTIDTKNLFDNSFSIRIINRKDEVFRPGCLHTQPHYSDCVHRECAINVNEGEKLCLQVENQHKSDGFPIYLHLYSMGHCWEIEIMLRSNHEVILPRDMTRGFTGKWQKNIKLSISTDARKTGLPYCEDIIKVFVTSRPTSFASLELPELLGVLERKFETTTRGSDYVESTDVWAALNFRIHTRLR